MGKGKEAKEKKKTPQIIFYRWGDAFWTWNHVPAHTHLLHLLNWLLATVADRGHNTVTIEKFYRKERDEDGGPHALYPCRALHFSVGGMDGEKALEFERYVNAQWVHGGPQGSSGKPPKVLVYRDRGTEKYFHLEVSENTHRTKEP